MSLHQCTCLPEMRPHSCGACIHCHCPENSPLGTDHFISQPDHQLYWDADQVNWSRGAQYEGKTPLNRESYFLTAMDNATFVKSKALRTWAILYKLDHGQATLEEVRFVLQDSLRDLVNYTKFCYDDLITSNRYNL